MTEFPAPDEYTVPVRDLASTDAPGLTVPYRSSAKKFQSRWIGDLPLRMAGSVKLETGNGIPRLAGTITNQTGKDFNDVYLAFHAGGPNDADRVLYLPSFAKNATIDLVKDFQKISLVGGDASLSRPGENKVLNDELAPPGFNTDQHLHCWANLWLGHFHSAGVTDANQDDPGYTYIFPMLSFFDRLPPAANYLSKESGQYGDQRYELFRRGGRILNASQSLTAGQLVILAKEKGPLPIPIEIDGDKVGGDGVILYQFLMPINRGDADKPTTQPVATN